MNFKKTIIGALLLFIAAPSFAQRTENVHGVFTYTVGEDETFSLAEMRHKCIVGAQNEAIKEKFNENIKANTNMVDMDISGEAISRFVEEIEAYSAAEWLGDSKPSVFKADYAADRLTFTAEVWGEAREITQPSVDLRWSILCGGTTDSYQSKKFNNRDRIYIKFKSPVSGYLAIYVLDSSNKKASCWLPYRSNTSGRFEVMAGQEYVLFDRDFDVNATPYRMVTNKPLELNNVVLIFSPNPFTKCNDDAGDFRHANSVDIDDFEKWLRKTRKRDNDMVVDRSQWLVITNANAKN